MECSIKEEHGQPIYCVSFNFYSEGCQNVFASCGSNGVSVSIISEVRPAKSPVVNTNLTVLFRMAQATIYRCLEGGAVEILQAYVDEDVSICGSVLCQCCTVKHDHAEC